MKPTLLLLSALFLTGCGMFKHTPPAQVENPALVTLKEKINIDPSLLEACPALPHLVDSTDAKVLEVTRQWLDAYQTCATNKAKLNGIVQDAFNLNK